MKKKFLMPVIAIVLIGVIAVIALGKPLLDKYSYSNERADMDGYFGVSGERSAIILQDEMLDRKSTRLNSSHM